MARLTARTNSFGGPRSPGIDTGVNPVDVFVGQQVRMLRKSLRISQGDLAKAIGVTFQQVQKYERGANRISASKLFAVAAHLNQPVAHFFPPIHAADTRKVAAVEADEFMDVLTRIPGHNTRRSLKDLLIVISEAG